MWCLRVQFRWRCRPQIPTLKTNSRLGQRPGPWPDCRAVCTLRLSQVGGSCEQIAVAAPCAPIAERDSTALRPGRNGAADRCRSWVHGAEGGDTRPRSPVKGLHQDPGRTNRANPGIIGIPNRANHGLMASGCSISALSAVKSRRSSSWPWTSNNSSNGSRCYSGVCNSCEACDRVNCTRFTRCRRIVRTTWATEKGNSTGPSRRFRNAAEFNHKSQFETALPNAGLSGSASMPR